MNKTYRTVWNATTGTWAAAEETARSKSKGSSRAASKAFVAVALGGMAIGGASAADVVGASESADGKTDDDSVIQVPITGTKSLMPMGTTGTLSTDSVGTMAALDDAYIKVRVGHYAPGTAAVAGDGSVAIGASADASAQSAVALGGNASATGQNATALGALASATNFNTLAAGVGAAASGNASTALGRGAATSGAYGVAVGYTANSSGTSAVAMGVGASASGNSSVAVGDGAAASVANSAAIGSFSVANRTNTVSVGSATLQRQITNVAAGTQANDAVNLSQMNAAIAAADNPYIGIRSGVYAPATPAVVGDGATAIGAAATAGALSSVAFGGGAVASNQNAMALGTISRAAGQETVAVGVGAGALANNAIALGRGATSSAAGATALGTYAVASANESVALGDGAVADRTNTVSVGSTTLRRQITNMAAGSQATDAVNVSQLTPVVNALGGGATINATTGAVTGPTYSLANPAGGPGRVNYNNVGDALTNLDSRTSQNTGDISDLQDKLADTGLVGGDGNTLAAVTYDQNADGTPNYGSVTLGGEGAATPVAIHNVAAGNLSATSTDAVNGSQLFATNTRVGSLEDSLKNGGAIDPITGESLAVVYDSAAKNHVTLGGTGASNPVVLSNVAQGVAGTDAVNVDQLNAAVANSSGPNPYIGGRGTGVAAQATGINAVALGLGSLANEINTISVGNSTTGLQRRITNVADGQNDNDAATIGQVNSLVGGATSTMSAAIDDVNNRISALGNGIGGSTSDIGLMGGLDGGTASGTNIAVGTGSSVSQTGRYNPTNGLAIGQNASVTDGDVAGASGAIAIGSSASASGSNAITIGTNSKNANSNTTAVGANTLVSGGGASAFGSGATASGANSLALGANSIANRGNAVSVGSDTLQRQITNLAAGTQTTDAVNLGQLNAAIAAVDNPYVKVDGQHDGSDDARVAAGSFGVAIGADANASGTTAIAMGAQATSTGTSSVALGAGAAATNSNAVALGGNSSASGANAIGLGAGTVASQNNAVAMGFNARALAANAVALGNTASAAAADSLAFGTLARVDAGATNGVAIGRAASVTGAAQNSVALGANSVADRLNSIAVGSTAQQRQIIYVSRGTADTDAVNVSQLKDAVAAFGGNAAVGADGSIVNPTYTVDGSTYHNVGDALNALAQRSGGGTDPLAVTYEQNPDGSANFDLVSLKGGANGTTITNVAAGAVNATSKDAINGSQLYGTAQSVADALGGGSAV
ncbi:ESPR-type extended signal peptide-containing protein, partial [Burkholderia sp. MSMB1459WGS]|uniref:beta strand repeat-containing protein n=1 Tax=Burkholderia sp. MSMB1459WGS TaxID=1637970 RepID=UPI000ADA0521